MAYDIGDRVRATATFSIQGTPTNGTVAARVKDPAGTITSPATTSGGTGVYYIDIDLNKAGAWHVEFVSTATVIAAVRDRITVRSNVFS